MKTKFKKNKGITLIVLVITIIVLLILAGVTIASLSGENGILTRAKEAKIATENAKKDELEKLEELNAYIENGGTGIFNGAKEVNRPQVTEGMIPVKFNGNDWVICAEDDNEWYDYTNKNWANIMLSDGTYKDKNNIGQVVKENELGSMFVWAPRYAYSINKYKTAVAGNEGTTQNITDVTFLVGKSNKDKDGKTYERDYDVTKVSEGQATPKIVHPAFTFGEKELTGIWSAKFEASMAENNNNTVNNNDVTTKTVKILPNALTWRYIKVGNIFDNCLNMNKTNNIYKLSNSTDSHLMKINEWGAIVYLATSQYGVTPTMNSKYTKENVSSTEIEGYSEWSGAKDYKTNISQSTTGNVTGIYDLNGGAWEYVAAYWDNETGNISSQGTSKYFTENKLKPEYEKYWDKYEVSQKEKDEDRKGLWDKDNTFNNIRKEITDNRFNLMKNKKGDVLYEVIKAGEYSYFGKKADNNYEWKKDVTPPSVIPYGSTCYNKDYALIGNCAQSFLLRGGGWGDGNYAGVFASHGSRGVVSFNVRFPSNLGCYVKMKN